MADPLHRDRTDQAEDAGPGRRISIVLADEA
jgi:hypothetical protein